MVIRLSPGTFSGLQSGLSGLRFPTFNLSSRSASLFLVLPRSNHRINQDRITRTSYASNHAHPPNRAQGFAFALETSRSMFEHCTLQHSNRVSAQKGPGGSRHGLRPGGSGCHISGRNGLQKDSGHSGANCHQSQGRRISCMSTLAVVLSPQKYRTSIASCACLCSALVPSHR